MWCTSSHRASPHVRRPRPNGPPCCRAGPRLGTRPSRSGPSGTWWVVWTAKSTKTAGNSHRNWLETTKNIQTTTGNVLQYEPKTSPPLPNAKVWKCCLNASKVQLVQVSVSCRLKSRIKSPRGPIPETESCGITGPESPPLPTGIQYCHVYHMYIIYCPDDLR